jgi:hypothetical protein
MQNNKIWMWGYTIEKFPSLVPSVEYPTWCSLETGARYMFADNLVPMNSTFDPAVLDDQTFWSRLKDAKELMMPLSHVPLDNIGVKWDLQYLATARKIAEMSLKDKRITSVIIDDFRDLVGPTRDMKAEELAEIYRAMKAINPELKLHLVRYTWQNQDELEDVRDYFDVISYWNMTVGTEYWANDYIRDVQMIAKRFKKPVFSGIYMHNYANCNGCAEGGPMPIETYKAMLPNAFHALRKGFIDGLVLLQPGWFSREDHREGVCYLKNYIEHYLGVHTFLER